MVMVSCQAVTILDAALMHLVSLFRVQISIG